MRKRNVNHLADTIFWYAIYFLPILAYVFYMTALHGSEPLEFNAFMVEKFHMVMPNNLLSNALVSLFGESGVLPLFESGAYGILDFFAWFVGVYLCHLAVDFILFIPRIAHKFMNKLTNTGD